MRIIAGSRKGHTFAAPEGRNTRPTLDRVKESLFGRLQMDIPGANVLDLFAGSGNLGLEALSRGAAFAVFCEHDRRSAAIVRQNIEKLRFEEQSLLYTMDYAAAIDAAVARGLRFDIVFLDPPYASTLAAQAIQALLARGAMTPDGLFSVEHAPDTEVSVLGYAADTRRHGDVAVTIFRRSE